MTYRHTDTLAVVGFSDFDYAGCVDDNKSTYGYIFMMVEGAISWKGFKQTLTVSSTMEVEYVACYKATCYAIWLWNYISTLEVDLISRPLKLFSDNFAIVSFFENTRSTFDSKHINVKFFFMKENVRTRSPPCTRPDLIGGSEPDLGKRGPHFHFQSKYKKKKKNSK